MAPFIGNYAARISTLVVLAAALILGSEGDATAGRNSGGGGKPPKDPPPDFVPALVYQRAGDIIVADETAQNSAVVHRLASGGGTSGGTPAWSPDGTKIVFVDIVGQSTGSCEPGWALMLLDVGGALAGTATAECLVNLGGQSIEVNSPAWSPGWIVYSDLVDYNSGASWDLFVVDPDGGVPMNLTNTEGLDEESPSWSPEGDRLAYVLRGGLTPDVLVSNFTSGSPPALSGTVSVLAGTALDGVSYINVPDWSNSTGSGLIAIEADNPEDLTREDIWVLDADNSSFLLNVTGNLGFGVGLPSWSGDDVELVVFTDVENACSFKQKDANGWQLGKVLSGESVVGCIEAFIGPPGTNTKLDFPRGLDWRP